MGQAEGPPAAGKASLLGVMPDVVKGLRDKPALLFGIGAGIVLVAVLGVTQELWLVIVVAAVLVAALGAWVITEARGRTGGGSTISNRTSARNHSVVIGGNQVVNQPSEERRQEAP